MHSAYAEKAVGSNYLFKVPLKHKSKGNQKILERKYALQEQRTLFLPTRKAYEIGRRF